MEVIEQKTSGSGYVFSCSCFLCNTCEKIYQDPIGNPNRSCPSCSKTNVKAQKVCENSTSEVQQTLNDPQQALDDLKSSLPFQVRHYKRQLKVMSTQITALRSKVQQQEQALNMAHTLLNEGEGEENEGCFFRETSPETSPEDPLHIQQLAVPKNRGGGVVSKGEQQQYQPGGHISRPYTAAGSEGHRIFQQNQQKYGQVQNMQFSEFHNTGAAPPSPLHSNTNSCNSRNAGGMPNIWIAPPSRSGTPVAVSHLEAPYPLQRGNVSKRPLTAPLGILPAVQGGDRNTIRRTESNMGVPANSGHSSQNFSQQPLLPHRASSPQIAVTPSSLYARDSTRSNPGTAGADGRPRSSGIDSFHGARAAHISQSDLKRQQRNDHLERERTREHQVASRLAR